MSPDAKSTTPPDSTRSLVWRNISVFKAAHNSLYLHPVFYHLNLKSCNQSQTLQQMVLLHFTLYQYRRYQTGLSLDWNWKVAKWVLCQQWTPPLRRSTRPCQPAGGHDDHETKRGVVCAEAARIRTRMHGAQVGLRRAFGVLTQGRVVALRLPPQVQSFGSPFGRNSSEIFFGANSPI